MIGTLTGAAWLFLAAAIPQALQDTLLEADPNYSKQKFELAVADMARSELVGYGPGYGAVKAILANGDKTLPWLIVKLDDHRPIGGFAIPNRWSSVREEFCAPSPAQVSDAVRLLLSSMTTHRDPYWCNELSRSKRQRAIDGWKRWYRLH